MVQAVDNSAKVKKESCCCEAVVFKLVYDVFCEMYQHCSCQLALNYSVNRELFLDNLPT